MKIYFVTVATVLAISGAARGQDDPAASPPPHDADAPAPADERSSKKEGSGEEENSTAGAAEAGETIIVTGEAPSTAEVLEQSAEAVDIVDTGRAKRQTADLGEVLARTEGVGVRRSGGLGSGERVSLAGLAGEQVPLFVDGVPLEMTGFALGLGNVPVNLVDRVEIYRGVVPLRFGADALGGAFNLVTDPEGRDSGASASYQAGSFGTHRVTLGAEHVHEPAGLFARVHGFTDTTRNDYEVDVEVADDSGQLRPATVERFHDGYRATGGGLEVGVTDQPWAEELSARAFVTDFAKDLQHNLVMTVPYGEVTYGELRTGGNVRYRQRLAPELELTALAGYAFTRTRFVDVGEWIYNWYGEQIRERRQPGEISGRPRDQVHWQHGALARVHASWTPAPDHELTMTLAPTITTRTGDERRQADPQARDPLTAQRDLLTLVTGAEYQLTALDYRFDNTLFVKDYVYAARTEEALPGDVFRRRDRTVHRLGVGDGARLWLGDWIYVKASYEWATRLPGPDEVFGDGVLVSPNLELEPETSHNINLGAAAETPRTAAGVFRGELTGFARLADDLIVLLGDDNILSYQNVFAARSVGVEAAAGWTSPGEHVSVDGNVTWQDFRNASDRGAFADFEGDRIPNRPYLFANGSARAALPGVFLTEDEISLAWTTRYVHAFFRSWESVGLRRFKQTVPSQLLHSLGLTYRVSGDPFAVSSTLEVQNLTDERAFDFFGVQRPGRAIYVKTAVEL